MEDNTKITIGFNFEDEFGNKHSASSRIQVFDELGENDLFVIGRQLNTFLSQCGYVRSNDLIFMTDINEEEYDAIEDFLNDYRKNSEKEVVFVEEADICD